MEKIKLLFNCKCCHQPFGVFLPEAVVEGDVNFTEMFTVPVGHGYGTTLAFPDVVIHRCSPTVMGIGEIVGFERVDEAENPIRAFVEQISDLDSI